jgi:6-phosphofructokinase
MKIAETIYFNPATTRAAVVCTGGLVPGINDAIRAIVLKLRDYGVEEKNILGIRHGEFSCALGRQSKQNISNRSFSLLLSFL